MADPEGPLTINKFRTNVSGNFEKAEDEPVIVYRYKTPYRAVLDINEFNELVRKAAMWDAVQAVTQGAAAPGISQAA